MNIKYQISKNLIKRFADLTGDKNPLHVDPTFGENSTYNGNIAHGLLLTIFVSLIETRLHKDQDYSLRQLTARFLQPVHPGDSLSIEYQQSSDDNARLTKEFVFSIHKERNQQTVTTGKVIFGSMTRIASATGDIVDESLLPLPIKDLDLADLGIDNIELDDEVLLNFRLQAAQLRELRGIIVEGLKDDGLDPSDNFLDANWLAASIFSTLVGMCLPGKHAILMGIKVDFNELLQWSHEYALIGRVQKVSKSMQTVVENVSLIDSRKPDKHLANGRITARIDEPPSRLSVTDFMREEDVSLGLSDKVVLVTGASRGIGSTIATLFAAHGARVAINYKRSKDEAELIAEQIFDAGGQAVAVQADVAVESQVNTMIDDVAEAFGPIDILVNNAARNYERSDFLKLSWADIQSDIDVILRGAFNCCRAVIPQMLANGGGRIINISTTATDDPPVGQTKYVVAKSGLVGLTRSLAVEYAADNITVNLVVPSFVQTDFTRHLSPMAIDDLRHTTPMARHATPLDVAKATVFLASSLASFTTGERILVTGGNSPLL